MPDADPERTSKVSCMMASIRHASIRRSERIEPDSFTRRGSTVTPRLYPIYVIPINVLLDEMTQLEPHQWLLKQGKLVEANSL